MKKPGDVKTIHRFQPFSERIQSISVDVSRKIEKRTEVPEDEETFFAEGLLKWRDLDQTAHFTKFYQSVEGCADTFAQLVYNEKKVVESLVEHLGVKDSMALEALLDLVVHLARDLQKDFYPHFKRFFTAIAVILNRSHKSWETLEQTFSCLSHLFKILWRKMLQDIKQVVALYRPFLSDSCRDYIRRFAGESLSYLMRKVKDRKGLFSIVFSLLEKYPDLVPGVGNLIFEMVKGAKGHFHSCTHETLGHLLRTVSEKGISSLPWHALQVSFNLMAEHVDQTNATALWTVLQEEMKALLTAAPISYDKLECLVTLLFHLIEFKGGCLLPRLSTDWCKDTVLPLLETIGEQATSEQFVSIVLGSFSSLLLCGKTTIEVSTISRCLSLVYRSECVRNLSCIFRFTEAIFSYGQFEKGVLHKLMDFCDDCLCESQYGENVVDNQSEVANVVDNQSEVLAVLSKLVADRRPERRGGQYKPQDVYRLKSKGAEITKFLHKILSQRELSYECLQLTWSALHLLPHSTNLVDAKDMLNDLFCHLYTTLLEDKLSSSQVGLVASQSLQCCLWAELCPDIISVTDLLKKYPSCPQVLRLCSLYLTYLKSSSTDREHMFALQKFEELYPLVKSNISSHKSQVRLLTFQLLSLFDVGERGVKTDAELESDQDERLGIFELCLQAEEKEATLTNYREKLRVLRELHYDLIMPRLPSDGTLNDVPLLYLSAVLYVNFSMLWPEVLTLMESHGNSLTQETLWTCYDGILTTAAHNCTVVTEPPSEDTECEEPSPLLEIYHQVESYHTNDSDRADFHNQRLLLWRALQNFSHSFEQHSAIFVGLFFQFLNDEYYISAFYDAPTEDIRRFQQTESMETDEAGESLADGKEKRTEGDQVQEQRKKRTKVIHETLITKLTLFSKFQHPMRISQEPRLTKLYNDLLLHRDMTIQQVALKCLMTYKKKHLTQYHENLERLLNENTFRAELTLFSIDAATSVVKAVDRPTVMPVLMRILYDCPLSDYSVDCVPCTDGIAKAL
ncbi:small subunit processome component 20 homolog [Watersipora subatra]|uniref:small subunit processome component 20 homolog n=1 Tax=Watersipora subatra TaxID=2589382 RepID=UPI00355AD8E5